MSYARQEERSSDAARRTPASLGKLALRSKRGKPSTSEFRDLRARIAPMDLRSKLGRANKLLRESLLQHVGGKPSATEAALIDLACQIDLRLQVLDARFADSDGEFSGHDAKQYLAWSNSLARLLQRLGLKSREPARASLADYIASQSSTRRVGADGPQRRSNPPLARKRPPTGSPRARLRAEGED